jgi:YesN/AraC family two-component response regulator
LAGDGKQGLEAAQSENFDIIFSDIKMPEMDGIELLTLLKEKEIEAPW